MLSAASAARIAEIAHGEGLDRYGRPMILHVRRVAAAVSAHGHPERLVVLAHLHDAVEKGSLGLDVLARAGVDAALVQSVDAITQRMGEPDRDYLHRAAADPDARVVKRYDLLDKTEGGRLDRLDAVTADLARAEAVARLRLFEEIAAGVASRPAASGWVATQA